MKSRQEGEDVETARTCVTGDAEYGMFGGGVLDEIRSCDVGIAGAEIDDDSSAYISWTIAANHQDAVLGLHHLADGRGAEKGASDVDVVKSVEFLN